MKNREFRELQVSSTQLAVIFFGILIIGVVIFLLGVSVGKKHAQASLKTSTMLAQKAPEQARDRLVVPEAKTPPANAASATPTPVKKETRPAVKIEETPPTADSPPAAPARKPTQSGAVATEVTPSKVESTPAVKERPKTPPDKPVTAAPKPSAAGAPPSSETKVPTPAAAPRKGLYYVQVGALATREEAAAIAQRFKSQGYPVVVFDPLPTDKKPLFRVRIGGFALKAEADSTRARLAAGGRVDYFTVRD